MVAARELPTATVFGLSSIQLHDRFWAARGVQVVRQGEPSEIVEGADLFLLTDSRLVTLFSLVRLLDTLSWARLKLLYVRLEDNRERGYRECAICDRDHNFIRFERTYGGHDPRLARAALTNDAEIARLWQRSPDTRTGWSTLKSAVGRQFRLAATERANVYDRSNADELSEFLRRLVQTWKRPDATVRRASRGPGATWVDPEAQVAADARAIGPIWVGAGRTLDTADSVVGPGVLWDDAGRAPEVEILQWDQIEPTQRLERPARPKNVSSFNRAAKRAFDIVFALIALLITLPIYPVVMVAILLEDGWPFFFAHRRETTGGRVFPCIKFRSMRKDAERIRRELAQRNQADGPQFFIEGDPRLTAVGKFIRATNIDELPQFINVLLGHMSVVGPRPSPYVENQFCPGWREARLSVRPGVTGLWQVMRTRQAGLDFQEWIKFDIEYVETRSWRLDLWIIRQTILQLLPKWGPWRNWGYGRES